ISKVGGLFAAGQKEPQLVLLDGPTQRAIELLDLIDRGLACETTGNQLLIDVGADKFGVQPADEQIAVKLVAAILGNHVGVDAPSGNFRCDVAGLIGGLLNNRIVNIVLGPAVGDAGVDKHAIEQIRGILGLVSVRGQVGWL